MSGLWRAQLLTHLDAGLLRVCFHGLQGCQCATTLHNDAAVLRLAQGQHAERRAALLTHLGCRCTPVSAHLATPSWVFCSSPQWASASCVPPQWWSGCPGAGG